MRSDVHPQAVRARVAQIAEKLPESDVAFLATLVAVHEVNRDRMLSALDREARALAEARDAIDGWNEAAERWKATEDAYRWFRLKVLGGLLVLLAMIVVLAVTG